MHPAATHARACTGPRHVLMLRDLKPGVYVAGSSALETSDQLLCTVIKEARGADAIRAHRYARTTTEASAFAVKQSSARNNDAPSGRWSRSQQPQLARSDHARWTVTDRSATSYGRKPYCVQKAANAQSFSANWAKRSGAKDTLRYTSTAANCETGTVCSSSSVTGSPSTSS